MTSVAFLCALGIVFVVSVHGRSILGSGGGVSLTDAQIRDAFGKLTSGTPEMRKATGARNTIGIQDIRNLAKALDRKYPGKGFKLPDGPISPATAIEILLRAYCQLLIDQGVVYLPHYCYGAVPRVHHPAIRPVSGDINSGATP